MDGYGYQNNRHWNQNSNNGNWNRNPNNRNWNQNQNKRPWNQNQNNGAGNQSTGAKKAKQNNPQNPPKAHLIREANKTNPIRMGKQGFSITYNAPEYKQQNPGKSFGEEVVDLFNQYADKIYRTEGKSCYFAQRLTDLPPVFIETDIPDPSIIVDALYEDLLVPTDQRLVKDVDKTVYWSNFIPVHKTCQNKPEIMLQTAKDVMRPVFLEQPEPKPLTYKFTMKCKQVGNAHIKNLEDELVKYASSAGVEHKRNDADKFPDAELILMLQGSGVWVSLLTQVRRFCSYSVSGVNRQKGFVPMPEKKKKTEEEKKEEKLRSLMNKLSRAQSEKKIEKLKTQIELFKAEMAAESELASKNHLHEARVSEESSKQEGASTEEEFSKEEDEEILKEGEEVPIED